ncbi:MAG: 30S ribosome-binding factor RbfA [Clostridia bacterium]|nr:30S ribosome-binding factor RbfA [Clostridia bacterium]MBQ6905476.1 30S ribosome-binding factor RbfA [Clostridia bacterium]
MSIRQERINEQVFRELPVILREVKDYRLRKAFVSITAVNVAKDLSSARIYYSAIPDGRSESLEVKDIQKGLESASGFIRSELAHRLNLRITPKLIFVFDDSAERALRISETLKVIGENENGNDK